MGFGRRVVLAFRAFWDLPEFRHASGRHCRGGCRTVAGDATAVVAITPAPVERPDDGAVLLLSVLQREGRLVDFLMEDLGTYADAQIGAAVRDVHANCRRALAGAFELEPILEGAEEQPVTVPSGFDPALDQAGGPGHRRPDRSAASCGIAGGGPRGSSSPRSAPRKRGRSSLPPKSKSPEAQKGRRVAPRFIVGIDLGTTNCALAAVSADPGEEQPPIEVREIPQLVNPHEVASRIAAAVVPVSAGRSRLPGGQPGAAVGTGAPHASPASSRASAGRRTRCASSSSAKSWLSHGGANRSGAILPWGAPRGGAEGLAGRRIGRATCAHLRDAWNAASRARAPAKTRTCC